MIALDELDRLAQEAQDRADQAAALMVFSRREAEMQEQSNPLAFAYGVRNAVFIMAALTVVGLILWRVL